MSISVNKIINNTVTVIYVGGGNWLTQSKPTNFHVFARRKALGKNESVDDWREVTDAEKEALEKADAEWVRPDQALIDRYNEACTDDMEKSRFGQYNESTGFFEIYNEIFDIKADEALAMLDSRLSTLNGYSSRYKRNGKIRANICGMNIVNNGSIDCTDIAYSSLKLEVLCLSRNTQNLSVTNARNMLASSTVRKVIPAFSLNINWSSGASDSNAFVCSYLEEISIKGLSASIKFTSSRLKLSSLRYLVDNAANTSTITVTVHADLFAALNGQGTYPFNGDGLQDWEQLLADATAKDIIFASA